MNEKLTAIELFVIEAVKKRRKIRNMTTRALSESIGLEESFVGLVENPKTRTKYNLNHLNEIAARRTQNKICTRSRPFAAPSAAVKSTPMIIPSRAFAAIAARLRCCSRGRSRSRFRSAFSHLLWIRRTAGNGSGNLSPSALMCRRNT